MFKYKNTCTQYTYLHHTCTCVCMHFLLQLHSPFLRDHIFRGPLQRSVYFPMNFESCPETYTRVHVVQTIHLVHVHVYVRGKS